MISKKSFSKIVDLTLALSPKIRMFPTYPPFTVLSWTKRETYGFESETIFMSTHTGTHIDVPSHFHAGGRRLHEFDVSEFFADALVLDFRHKKPKTHITAEDIRSSFPKAGRGSRTPEMVILRTGWDKNVNAPNYYKESIGLSKDGAQFLVKKSLKIVGIDGPNIDHPEGLDYPAHNTLLSSGVCVVENIQNLNKVGTERFMFVGLPLRIVDASGSPIRAVAIV